MRGVSALYRLPECSPRPTGPWFHPPTDLGAVHSLSCMLQTGFYYNLTMDTTPCRYWWQPRMPQYKAPWYLVSSVWTLKLSSVSVYWPNGNKTGTTPRATSCKMWNSFYSHGGILVAPSAVTRLWWFSWGLALPVCPHTHLPCTHFNVLLSIKHILLDCLRYTIRHQRFYLPSTISDVLGDDPDILTQVLAFLWAIDLFHLL
jgi:hypothetical protein